MSNFNAGAIEANLALGRSSWTKDLKKTQKEIQDLENTSITVGLDMDDDNFKVALDNAERMLDDFDDSTYTPSIEIDEDEFNATIERLNSRLDDLDDRNVIIQIFADTDNAEVTLDNFERNLDALDRDPVSIAIDVVTREANALLEALEERLDLLDSRRVVVEVDADTDNAMVGFSLIEDEITMLEQETVTIPIDVDALAAEEKLIEIASFTQTLGLETVNIDVEVDGYGTAIAQMVTLEGQMRVLDGAEIDIDVDYDRNAMAGLVGDGAGGGGGGSLGLLRVLIYAIIALSPVLSVAIGAATAAVVAFAAALAGALGAALVLGGGLAGLVARFKDTDPSEYTEAMQRFSDAIDGVKDAWDKFLDGIDDAGFSLMAQGLGLVEDILPRLIPLFNTTAEMVGRVLDSVGEFVDSSEFNEMLAFFEGFGVDMLESFLEIGGNLIQFFGRLFQAIAPFASEMMDSLEEMTAGWSAWADDLENNQGFQEFLENAATYGPMVLDMLGSLLQAFINVGRALEPFAGPMLSGLTAVFDYIAGMDPNLLSGIIAGFAGLWLGINVLLPVLSGLMTILPLLGGALAFAFSPIGLVVIAIAGLIAVIGYLWVTNEDFRDGVIATWTQIVETLTPIIEDIVAAIRDNWGPIADWAKGVFNDIVATVQDAFTIIRITTDGAMQMITFLWNAFGADLIRIGKGVFQVIGGIIRGFFQIVRGIFQVIKSVLTGDWRGAWDGIKRITAGAVTAVTGIVRGFVNILGGLWNIIKVSFNAAWNATWNGAKGAFTNFGSWVRGRMTALIGWFGGIGGKISSAVSNIWDGIGQSFRNVINGIIGMWNNLSFSVDIPDKIPGLPDSFTVNTPNVPTLARGAYLTEPTLNVAGEAGPEIVAPEPVLRRIVEEHSGSNIDYGRLASAVAAALASVLPRSISAEDLERLIEAASVNLNIEANTDDGRTAAQRLASTIGFELRMLGYGGA